MEVSDPISADLSRAFRVKPVLGVFGSRGCDAVLGQLGARLAAGHPSTVLLTGSPGIGKTTAARAFADRQGRKGGVRMINPSDMSEDWQDHLVAPAPPVGAGGSKPGEMLIVDDAMALTATQKVQLLRQVESDRSGSRPRSIVLVGDDSLPGVVRTWVGAGHPSLEWHTIRCAPLERDEIAGYVRQRLSEAGGLGPSDRIPFDAEAVDLLFDLSRGVPRFVDHFADRVLYEASQERRPIVDGDLLRASLLDTSHLDIGWPAASTRDIPPTVARAPSAAGPAMPNADPEPLRADPTQAPRSDPGGRRRGTVVALSFVLIFGLAGAAALRVGAPLSTASPDPVPISPGAALLPATAHDPARHAAADTASAPGLAPPSGVDMDPDPAQLLTEGLRAGADRPLDAALAYERAALWGNIRAAYFMGQLFETGLGVPVDNLRAQAWYSVAAGVPGADARLTALANLPSPGEGLASAPQPFRHAVFQSGRTVLHWRSLSGPSPHRYVVEYVLADDGNQLRQTQTTLSAMLLERPVIRWRVIGLDEQGRPSAASAWSSAIPPPR